MMGLTASYAWDLPTGAAVVCAFGAVVLLCGLAAIRRGTGKADEKLS